LAVVGPLSGTKQVAMRHHRFETSMALYTIFGTPLLPPLPGGGGGAIEDAAKSPNSVQFAQFGVTEG